MNENPNPSQMKIAKQHYAEDTSQIESGAPTMEAEELVVQEMLLRDRNSQGKLDNEENEVVLTRP